MNFITQVTWPGGARGTTPSARFLRHYKRITPSWFEISLAGPSSLPRLHGRGMAEPIHRQRVSYTTANLLHRTDPKYTCLPVFNPPVYMTWRCPDLDTVSVILRTPTPLNRIGSYQAFLDFFCYPTLHDMRGWMNLHTASVIRTPPLTYYTVVASKKHFWMHVIT